MYLQGNLDAHAAVAALPHNAPAPQLVEVAPQLAAFHTKLVSHDAEDAGVAATGLVAGR